MKFQRTNQIALFRRSLKFKVLNVSYNVEALLSSPEGSISARKRKAIKSLVKKEKVRNGCAGSFGVPCGNQNIHRSSPCRPCYEKKTHLNSANELLTQVLGFNSSSTSSINVMNYKKKACISCEKVSLSPGDPYCTECLSSKIGIRVFQSMIPGAGLGVWTTKVFEKDDPIDLEYGGKVITKDDFEQMSLMAAWDSDINRRLDYVIEVKDSMFVDGLPDASRLSRV